MKEKVFRSIDLTIISILFLTFISSLIYPPYRNIYSEIIYVLLISFSVFLFIIKFKFSNETYHNETPVDNLLFLLFLWYILSTIFATNKFNSLNATVSFSSLLAFYYLIHNYAKTFYKNFLWILFFATTLLSIYGIYQYFYSFNHTLNYVQTNSVGNVAEIIVGSKSNRIFSTFIYPNTFAGFLIMIIPVLIGFIKNEKNSRTFLIPLLLLFIFALLLTKSIGAFISLILSIIIVLVLISDRTIRNFRIFLLYFIVLIVIIFIFIMKERGWHNFILNLSEKYSSNIKMLHLSSGYLISGAGPGNFEEVYNTCGTKKASYLKYAYNILVQTIIELGIPGLLILLLILFSQYKIILQNFFFLKTPQSKIFITSLLISITAFLIHNLVDFDIYNFELSMVFALLVAILNSQIIIGTIEIKKLKLIYYLGLNPGKRRSIIFAITLLILGLSAINTEKNIYISTIINILIAIGFTIWSISKEKIRRTDFDIPILVLIFMIILSAFYSPDIYKFVNYTTLILSAIIVFYLYSQFLRRYIYKIIISNYLIIAGVIVSFFIIIIYILDFFKIPFSLINIKPDFDMFSLFLIIPFSFLLSRILFEKKIDHQNQKIFTLVILSVAQFLTTIKTGLLLQLLVFIFIWIYYIKNKTNVKDIYQKELFKSNILKLLSIVIILMILIPSPTLNLKTPVINNKIHAFNKIRLLVSSFRMIIDKPFTGHGIGSFASVFPAYNFPSNGISQYQTLHDLSGNEFIQTGVALGIPGLILLSIIIYLIIKNLPEIGGHRKVWSASAGAYFSIIGLLFSCLFFNTFHFPGLLLTFAILASMLSKEKYSISTIPKESLFFVKIYYFIHLIFAFIIFSFIIRPLIGYILINYFDKTKDLKYLQYAITVEPLKADYFFKKGILFEKAGMYKESMINFKNAHILDKKNYKYLQYMGRCSSYLNDTSSAIEFYQKSIKYNPFNAFAYYELANLYLKINDLNNTKKHIIKSIKCEPNFISAKHLFATILIQEKNLISALNQYNEIEQIIYKYAPETEYEKSLLDFSVEILYFNKALILKNIGNDELSEYYFKKYYELSGNKNIKNKYPGKKGM